MSVASNPERKPPRTPDVGARRGPVPGSDGGAPEVWTAPAPALLDGIVFRSDAPSSFAMYTFGGELLACEPAPHGHGVLMVCRCSSDEEDGAQLNWID